MVRVAFLIESMGVVWGLPWCVACVLLWAGCQEREQTASERAAYQAMQIRIQEKMIHHQSTQHLTEQKPVTQI